MNQNMTDKKKEKPFVFVRCLTYNHEKYIEDALKGFVMQKTDFPFLAVVIDDCSTDGTADIVRRYETKHPDKIKGIYLPHNFTKTREDKRPYYQQYMDKATYWAECEGDDYWTDPLKLQKQVDFLEANPEYSLCFHKVNTLMQATGEMKEEFIVRDMPGDSSMVDLATGNYIHTPSVMLRYDKQVQKKIFSLGSCMPSDYVWWMLYAEKGKIFKFEEPMAVYRVGSGIWSTDESVRPDLEMLMTLNKLWVAIDNDEVRKVLQEQILKQKQAVLDFVAHLQHDLYVVRSSKAYRLGKILLKPFRYMRNILK